MAVVRKKKRKCSKRGADPIGAKRIKTRWNDPKTKEDLDSTLHHTPERCGYLKLRLEQTSRLIVQTRNVRLVVLAISKQWGISRRRAQQYVRMVFDIWAENYRGDIVDHSVQAIADREEIIRRALLEGDLKTALRATDSRDKILGVLQENLQIKGNVSMSLADLLRQSKNGDGTHHFERGSRFADLGKAEEKN